MAPVLVLIAAGFTAAMNNGVDNIREIREETALCVEFVDHFREVKQDKQWLKKEKKSEPSDKIVRVDMAFPAVELVHFCACDPINWNRYGSGLTREERKKIKL